MLSRCKDTICYLFGYGLRILDSPLQLGFLHNISLFATIIIENMLTVARGGALCIIFFKEIEGWSILGKVTKAIVKISSTSFNSSSYNSLGVEITPRLPFKG